MENYRLNSVENERIDKFISEQLPGISRSYAQRLIGDGLVLVDGRRVKANLKLKTGQEISIQVPDAQKLEVEAEAIPLDIVYEDAHLLVVNKPQGMVVHPAAGNYSGTLVNALMEHCGSSLSAINGVIRPGIVHRIDKDTSGLLLVAKDDKTHTGLAAQIKEHSLVRRYIAIVYGNFQQDSGTVDAPIGRSSNDRKKMAVTDKNSRSAVTHYQVLERFGNHTFIECRLETGRTHQIRVHMSHIGHPIVGDKTYGPKKENFNLQGQLLHAKVLGFIHPITGEKLIFESDVPERFEKILQLLRKGNNA